MLSQFKCRYDSDDGGNENADKCNSDFPNQYAACNSIGGGNANIQLGSRHFLIQSNWVLSAGTCKSECRASQLVGPLGTNSSAHAR